MKNIFYFPLKALGFIFEKFMQGLLWLLLKIPAVREDYEEWQIYQKMLP